MGNDEEGEEPVPEDRTDRTDRTFTPEEMVKVVTHSLGVLAEEIECIRSHIEHAEWIEAAMHIRSAMAGLHTIGSNLMYVWTPEQAMEVTRMIIEQEMGLPTKAIKLFDENGQIAGFGVRVDDVEVPDDLSGLSDTGPAGPSDSGSSEPGEY